MKTIFTVILAVAASVSAQFTFPICADTCTLETLPVSMCSSTDYKCLCQDTPYMQALVTCVVKDCDQADVVRTHNSAVKLCALYGITLPSQNLPTATVMSTVTSKPTAVVVPAVTVVVAASTSGAAPAETTTTTTATASLNGVSTTTTPTSTATIVGGAKGINHPATDASNPTVSTGTSAGTNGAAKMAGPGFMAAAMGAALFVL